MKVEKFQSYTFDAKNTKSVKNLDNTARTVLYSSNPVAKPSFTGKKLSFIDRFFPLKLNDATKELLEYFPRGERKAYEWMNRLGDWAKGEAAGIGITAIGTGLVAPWPIAYNPIVNHQLKQRNATPEEIEEKHKTQKYSAWRQPVSAVLAVIFQLGVQKPIEKALQYMTNEPDTLFNGTVYNQSFLNNEDYLEREIKSKLKTKDKAKIKAEKETRLKAQIDEITKVLKSIKADDTHVKIGNNIVPIDALAQALNNQIEDYIEFAEVLKKSDEKIKHYNIRAKELVNNEQTLRQLLSPENINENIDRIMGENPKLNRPKALRKFIQETRKTYENTNSEMVNILDHIIGKEDSVIESSCARNLERIDKVKKACGGTYSMDKYYTFLLDCNQKITERITALKELIIPQEEWKAIKPSELKSRIEKIINICHYDRKKTELHNLFKDKGIFLSNSDTLRNKVYEDIIKKGYREVVKAKYKLFSQITKASIATFIMLPITCTALNEVYPRFMNIFFPNLSGKKTPKTEVKNGGAE